MSLARQIGGPIPVDRVAQSRLCGVDFELPPVSERAIGPAVRDKLLALMTGRDPDPYGWVESIR